MPSWWAGQCAEKEYSYLTQKPILRSTQGARFLMALGRNCGSVERQSSRSRGVELFTVHYLFFSFVSEQKIEA